VLKKHFALMWLDEYLQRVALQPIVVTPKVISLQKTASRMESHGQEGILQITRATYELIKDEFVCEPHGTVNVKGKGEMEVWYVMQAGWK
jgi:hypothetical protein